MEMRGLVQPGSSRPGSAYPGTPFHKVASRASETARPSGVLISPSASSRQSSSTPSSAAALRMALARTRPAASVTADPAIMAWRLANPPMPWLTNAVSPARTWTACAATPKCAAHSCARVVAMPCPMASAPV